MWRWLTQVSRGVTDESQLTMSLVCTGYSDGRRDPSPMSSMNRSWQCRSCAPGLRPGAHERHFQTLVTVTSSISAVYQLYWYFSQKGLLCQEQFGFIQGRNTIKAVESVVTSILNSFEDKTTCSATFRQAAKKRHLFALPRISVCYTWLNILGIKHLRLTREGLFVSV